MTRTRSKYYLLSLLGALMVAVGVLAVAPPAQAQTQGDPTINKECRPNPVQIGQQITCTIDVVRSPGTVAFVDVTDTLPDGLKVTGATSALIAAPGATFPIACKVDGNTVMCPPPGGTVTINETSDTFRVTIKATAQQCGTFQNTATAEGAVVVPDLGSFTVEDTAEINVVGCGAAGGKHHHHKKHHHKHHGGGGGGGISNTA